MTSPRPPRRRASGDRLAAASAKAGILVEALPYIRRFWGQMVVVKYGGNALADAEARPARFAEDIVLMRPVGMRPVVVHGGGPQIGELMARLGKVPEFLDGLRVTDAETLDIARMVLVGKVNRDIVSAINVHGPLAVGPVAARTPGSSRAQARDPELGFVGDVTAVNPDLLERLLAEDLIPVVVDHRRRRHRPGVQHQRRHRGRRHRRGARRREDRVPDRRRRVCCATVDDPEQPRSPAHGRRAARPCSPTAPSTGGMIPKVARASTRSIAASAHAHILDGRVPHVLLLEIFTDAGIGTMVTRPTTPP